MITFAFAFQEISFLVSNGPIAQLVRAPDS